MKVRYFVGRKCVLTEAAPESPHVNDELHIDEGYFRVKRVIRRIPMCPPDEVHAYLEITEPEPSFPFW